jgi:two-component system, chemotaxis family, CheB/CheR fusion protein
MRRGKQQFLAASEREVCLMNEHDQYTSSRDSRLVIVGSSAGGIEALSVFVAALPIDFPAPILLAQHLDPRRQSSLDAILRRRTTLPVNVIGAHTLLRAGEIYVVPEHCHVIINDGYAETQEDALGRPMPSVDLLLRSAARVYGDHLIAVILTGSGSNGAAGARAVKQAGGTIIIQNPATARFPSMPLALPSTIVDFQIDIEGLAPLLTVLLAEEDQPVDDLSRKAFRYIIEDIREREYLDLHRFKTERLVRQIHYRMLSTGTPAMPDYLNLLRQHPAEREKLVKALLVSPRQFFHDPDTFASLSKTILPELMARARDHTLRFWVAGCATGEEAYALAMLVSDLLAAEPAHWDVKIFATDLDESAISFARRGVYAEDELEGLPPTYRERFFEHIDHGYRVVRSVRSLVIFGQHDLRYNAPFTAIDLLVCRNALSHFTPAMQEYLLNQFAFSLFPGGYLLLGKHESVRPPTEMYATANREGNVYRCTDRARLAEPLPVHLDQKEPGLPFQPVSSFLAAPSPSISQVTSPAFDIGQLRRFNELLLRAFPIGIVVIDRSYAILTANGIARRLLFLRESPPGQDFFHSSLGLPYQEVRDAIDRAFRERSAITLPEIELDVADGNSARFVALSLSSIQLDATPPDLVVLSVIDITEQVQTRRYLEAFQAEQGKLVGALEDTNRRLSETNQMLLDANEELEAANEDLMVAQEELQATLEELETTREELQASYDEIEAQDETLQTQTGDLQAQNKRLVEERRHLAELIEYAPFSVVTLRGPDLRVESFNARYSRLLKGQDVLGRPLLEVVGQFWESDGLMVRLANEVYQSGMPRTLHVSREPLPVSKEKAKQIGPMYTLLPARHANGMVSGVIIYGADGVEAQEGMTEVGQPDLAC